MPESSFECAKIGSLLSRMSTQANKITPNIAKTPTVIYYNYSVCEKE
jgi:hypothetical protein